MQDSATLRYPQDFADVETDALHRAGVVHVAGEPARSVPDGVGPQLVFALPVLVTE